MSNEITEVIKSGEPAIKQEESADKSAEAKAKERQDFFRKLAEVKESITEGVITCW